MITFLSPLFLIGILSAAIPLVLHLSRSRRTKKMRFSTTRFFTDQFLRSYRMSRLKELLLLACRMAVCGLLAIALAQPLVMPKGQTFLGQGARAVVLVLDDSASMTYREKGVSLLERAKKAAVAVLEGMHPGDRAAVVLAGRHAKGPEVLFPEPTSELGQVIQSVNGVQAASLGTDLTGALVLAERMAAADPASNREVYVLSDLQETGWERREEAGTQNREADVNFFFVPLRPEKVANRAVTSVQYGASRPMVGVPFAIRPRVVSQGEEASAVEVRLFVDGRKVGERRLEKLTNGRWALPRFYHTFATGGWHSGYVEIDDEGLTQDNRRYFALEVLDSVKLLAVNGAPSQVARMDELFFLRTALAAGEGEKSPLKMDVIGAPALANTDLGKYPLVLLANVNSLSAGAVEKLEAFVDRGGSLLFFLGDKVDPSFYNQHFAAETRLHGGLLPGKLGRVEGDPRGTDSFARVGEVDYDHPILTAFQEPKFADLGGITFQAFWKIELGEGRVLMRAQNGSPLLCEKAFGKGRVLLFTSTCDRDWTNFPVRPAYLPWVHRLVGYLAQESAGQQSFYATGDALPVPVSATEGIPPALMKKPDGTAGRAVLGDDPKQPLEFTDTRNAGIYRLLGDNGKDRQLFAVNLESYESDLTYLDGPEAGGKPIEDRLKERMDGRPFVYLVSDPAKVVEASLEARRGFKLWNLVLMAVLALALFEPWLANRISARHYARPREEGIPSGAKVATAIPRTEIAERAEEVGTR